MAFDFLQHQNDALKTLTLKIAISPFTIYPEDLSMQKKQL